MTIVYRHWDEKEEPWAAWHCGFCKPLNMRSVEEARTNTNTRVMTIYYNPSHCDYQYVRMTLDEPIFKRLPGNFQHQPYCTYCSVSEGNIHHIGCILERCPKCKEFFRICPCRITLYYKSPEDELGVYFPTSFQPPMICKECKMFKSASSYRVSMKVSNNLTKWLRRFCLSWNRPMDELCSCHMGELQMMRNYNQGIYDNDVTCTNRILTALEDSRNSIIEFDYETLWWVYSRTEPLYTIPQTVLPFINRVKEMFRFDELGHKLTCSDCTWYACQSLYSKSLGCSSKGRMQFPYLSHEGTGFP